MIHAASREALANLRDHADGVLRGLDESALFTVADELYSVAGLLVNQPRLRRTLADPASAPEGRAALVERLLSGKVSDAALSIVSSAASQRWSSAWDLTDALELCGDEALFSVAERNHELDSVEDELFRLERILSGESRLATLLDEKSAPTPGRVELIRGLLEGKTTQVTARLVQHAVLSDRKSGIVLALDGLLVQAAERQNRTIARVSAAAPLSDEQEARLASALSQIYGREIAVRVAINPAVRGGLVVRVGDEVIDGSVASRLAEARAELAG